MTNRRGFFGVMAAAPLAGRAAAERIMQESGIGMNVGYGANALQGRAEGVTSSAGNILGGKASKPMHQLWQEAFKKFPGLVGEQESLTFEDERHVAFIDPDIAACRSFSMAAKITFQRQRNVARKMEKMQEKPWWEKNQSIFERLNSLIK